jgi:hypothetical protein
MSQESTTDGECEPTQPYIDQVDNLDNWPHEHQPGWSQYSSQDSDVSRVPCSLGVPLTQEDPPESAQDSVIVIPDTPESTQASTVVSRRVRPLLSGVEAAEQMKTITSDLEAKHYTVFTHKSSNGKTMHLAFFVYDETDDI